MSKAIEIKCHCGSVHFNLNVPETALPLTAYMCHCSICRYSSGGPGSFHCIVPEDVLPEWISPSSDANTTYCDVPGPEYGLKFCSTCGCHIGCYGDDGSWTPSAAVIVNPSPEIVTWKQHVFSKSAIDGGLSNHLTHIGGKELRSWNPPDDDLTAKLVIPEQEVGEDGKERLRAKCFCGGVSFTIKRPSEEVLSNEKMTKYVSPLDKKKWIALWDVCNDCRLVNGTPVVGWTFVPLSCVEPRIGPDLKFGTLKTYSSSPDVTRAFCGTCSATFFYAHPSRQFGDDMVVDIATGVLRAPEGALAENWLTWRTRIAHVGSGLERDEAWVTGLQEGLKKWTEEKYGRALDAEV